MEANNLTISVDPSEAEELSLSTTSTLAPLQVSSLPEDQVSSRGETEESSGKSRSVLVSSFRKELFSYICFATLAVVLTLTCPKTILWTETASKSKTEGENRLQGSNSNSCVIKSEVLCELLLAYILVIIALFTVQGSDPGYITKEMMNQISVGEDEEGLLNMESRRFMDAGDETKVFTRVLPRHRTEMASMSSAEASVETNDVAMERYENVRKYCDICGFYPPIRSHHCRKCGRCVATFDHHCNFIGTCIGERNNCRFYCFLTIQLLGFLVCNRIVTSSSLHLQLHSSVSSMAFWTQNAWLVIIAKAYLKPLTFCAALMWLVHSFFVLLNVTQFECGKGPTHIDYLKDTRQCDFPFSKGFDTNLRYFCCWRDTAWKALLGIKTKWTPTIWKRPDPPIRDSDNCWEHPCENKYYSCC